ncbi:hypothetical protein M2132_000863 [Dysgonomonas sp. PH5-45]|uniref:hypothetical protein n=1 Tax=unclassified Dysgonomonas TaxID=2630389 RepID=UPI002473F673|nr:MULTISPECIES: hypothetical protein [unclassified Dysgonomonas]MDH6354535.1 hypothetical protein [Dysgonomonas sp. PH5-45]MDH6387409.1 hypothetical protein [Dysgonomonas sp. PH5-37]
MREVFINNQRVDMEGDGYAAMIYPSPIFKDLSSIQSNGTTTFTLPKTERNLAIIGCSDQADVRGDFPYSEYTFEEYRNGIPVIHNGRCKLLKIGEKIELATVWGPKVNMSDLLKKKLTELEPYSVTRDEDGKPHYSKPEASESENFVTWSSGTSFLSADSNDDFGFLCADFGMGVKDTRYMHPSARATYVIDQIGANMGMDIRFKNDEVRQTLAHKWLPLPTRNANILTWTRNSDYKFPKRFLNSFDDNLGYNITNVEVITPNQNSEILKEYPETPGNYAFSMYGEICLSVEYFLRENYWVREYGYSWDDIRYKEVVVRKDEDQPEEIVDLRGDTTMYNVEISYAGNTYLFPLEEKAQTYREYFKGGHPLNAPGTNSPFWDMRLVVVPISEEVAKFVEFTAEPSDSNVDRATDMYATMRLRKRIVTDGKVSFRYYEIPFSTDVRYNPGGFETDPLPGSSEGLNKNPEIGNGMPSSIIEGGGGNPSGPMFCYLPTSANWVTVFFTLYKRPDEVKPGESFPILHNLPDITCLDFMKSIMQMYGLYPQYLPKENVLELVSIDHIYQRVPEADNWNGRLVANKGIIPIEHTINDYAQKNWMRYTQDDVKRTDADGFVVVNNTALSDEKNIFEIKFAITENHNGRVNDNSQRSVFAYMPCYEPGKVTDDEPKPEPTFRGKIKPRLLSEGEYNISANSQKKIKKLIFDKPLQFGSFTLKEDEVCLIPVYYSKYQRVVRRPVAIECSVYMSDMDIHRFEATRPVYLKGQYWMPIQVSIDAKNLAKCKLLLMPETTK